MKNLFILFMLLCSIPLFSQVRKEYSNLYENDTCKKEFLFSKSKMYIVDIFKSANDVIQNYDPSGGIGQARLSSALPATGNWKTDKDEYAKMMKLPKEERKVVDGYDDFLIEEDGF
jgi:hypothetical protein